NGEDRLTTVRYRAPHSDHWEERPLEWALDRIAHMVKQTRDETFVERDEQGILVNRTLGIGHIGGATLDNEENYIIKKAYTGGLGIVAVENQARIGHSSTVPGLGSRFGFGGATTTQQSLADSDCIIIMGSNMAENHPVGFRFVMQAKERGATIIHIDPRFSRTSAMADLHVPIRPGTDLLFLGALINYTLENDLWFKEYVQHYT